MICEGDSSGPFVMWFLGEGHGGSAWLCAGAKSQLFAEE